MEDGITQTHLLSGLSFQTCVADTEPQASSMDPTSQVGTYGDLRIFCPNFNSNQNMDS